MYPLSRRSVPSRRSFANTTAWLRSSARAQRPDGAATYNITHGAQDTPHYPVRALLCRHARTHTRSLRAHAQPIMGSAATHGCSERRRSLLAHWAHAMAYRGWRVVECMSWQLKQRSALLRWSSWLRSLSLCLDGCPSRNGPASDQCNTDTCHATRSMRLEYTAI